MTPNSSGRSPNPLPIFIVGVITLHGEAPTPAAPVLPHSTTSPASHANSCGASLYTWYWNAVVRFIKPLALEPKVAASAGGRTNVQVDATVIPKFSVMRLEKSPATSFSRPAGLALLNSTVGSDISSATQGSSTVSVAGRKRAPTKQCASASPSGTSASASPGRAAHMIRLNMAYSADWM